MKKSIRTLFIAALAAALAAGTLSTASAAASFNKANEINVVSRESGSGTRGAFVELVGILQDKKDMTTDEAAIASRTDIMLTNVANDAHAIGYVSLGSVNSTVKALSFDGVAATVENVKNKTYKLSRPFVIATKSKVTPRTLDFYNFILSAEGQKIISDGGYIAVNDNAPAFTSKKLEGKEEPTISLHCDKSVPIDEVVKVMNIAKDNRYRLILATSPE